MCRVHVSCGIAVDPPRWGAEHRSAFGEWPVGDRRSVFLSFPGLRVCELPRDNGNETYRYPNGVEARLPTLSEWMMFLHFLLPRVGRGRPTLGWQIFTPLA